jgi:hypothetical protein
MIIMCEQIKKSGKSGTAYVIDASVPCSVFDRGAGVDDMHRLSDSKLAFRIGSLQQMHGC